MRLARMALAALPAIETRSQFSTGPTPVAPDQKPSRFMMLPRFAFWFTVFAVFCRPALGRVEGEAVVGRPFGVAQVTLSGLEAGIDANRVQIEEKNGRVFYPAVTQGVIGRLIGQILGSSTERPTAGITIQFLFRGDEPLELTIYAPQPVPLVLQPRADNQRRLERDVTQWWRQYNAYWRQQHAEDNQPPLVSAYLTAMLAQRLALEPPLLERLQTKQPSTTTTQSLELMLGM